MNAAVYWKATKILLTLVSPLQKVTSEPGTAHCVCNKQAVKILFNDGKIAVANLIEAYIDELNKGVEWADYDFKNSSHFYNPITGKGAWRWPNAVMECNLHVSLAKQFAAVKNYKKAMFYLGAAVHLIQDMCVPHHSRGVMLKGHQEFEDWVEKEHEKFLIDKGGSYHKYTSPARWIINNAKFSYTLYPLVEDGSPLLDYQEATSKLLILSQVTTAGFFASFCEEVFKL